MSSLTTLSETRFAELQRAFGGRRQCVRPVEAPVQTVCAWCTPKPELDRLNCAYPAQISHGLCPACAARLLGEAA
jgi:hypothetical protein